MPGSPGFVLDGNRMHEVESIIEVLTESGDQATSDMQEWVRNLIAHTSGTHATLITPTISTQNLGPLHGCGREHDS